MNPDTVTHLSTNRAHRWLTLLIKANALTTTPDHQPITMLETSVTLLAVALHHFQFSWNMVVRLRVRSVHQLRLQTIVHFLTSCTHTTAVEWGSPQSRRKNCPRFPGFSRAINYTFRTVCISKIDDTLFVLKLGTKPWQLLNIANLAYFRYLWRLLFVNRNSTVSKNGQFFTQLRLNTSVHHVKRGRTSHSSCWMCFCTLINQFIKLEQRKSLQKYQTTDHRQIYLRNISGDYHGDD